MTKKNDEIEKERTLALIREKKTLVFDRSDADEQRNLSMKLFN
jgi:hypothetical protein